MYRQETIICGILHFKSTPESPWVAYNQEQLTKQLTRSNEDNSKLFQQRDSLLNVLEKIMKNTLIDIDLYREAENAIKTPS